MSSDGSKVSNWRRLLAKVERSVSPQTVCSMKAGKKNATAPWVVQCCSSPKASVTLAFDMLRKHDGRYIVDVELRDVKAPNLTLHVEAIVEWYTRPQNFNVSAETDKSTWPAATYNKKVTLDGRGNITCFFWDTLRALTVHLEVYALGDAPYSGNLPGGLNALRLERTLSDVELKVNGEVFPAHRNVLAANSPVFRAMFTSGLKEAQDGVVEIEGPSSTVFGVFLEFLYTADLTDSKDCEMELLELADRYMVDHLRAACEQRLQDMHWSTALGILQLADYKPAISSVLRGQAVRVLVENWDVMHTTAKWNDFRDSSPMLADAVRTAKELSASVRKKQGKKGK